MNAEQAWTATMGQLKMDMPKAAYDTWVKNCQLVAYTDSHFKVAVPNPYARDWLESRLSSTVNRILTGFMDLPQQVDFVLQAAETRAQEEPAEAAEPSSFSSLPLPVPVLRKVGRINPRFSFSSFVVGSCNRLAHAAAMAVAASPAAGYNPLFLYGGVGLGKTHLLHAIGNQAQAAGHRVLYVTSEEFTNDLIQAIRTHTTHEFRERYRQADILLVDDIQFISGKEATQEEFFHTFNALHESGKQIVIGCDRPPKALATLEERLRSRFEMGLMADIQPPDLETRLAILRARADKAGKVVPDEILGLIARRFEANIRELEGALNRLVAFSDLSGLPVTPQLVQTALVDLVPVQADLHPEDVLRAVAEVFRVSRDRLISRDRSQEIALPRQVAMYLLRQEVNCSLHQIGSVLGGRDHTTVLYACEKITKLLKSDVSLQGSLQRVRERLFGTA